MSEILNDLNDKGDEVIAFKEHGEKLSEDHNAHAKRFVEIQDIQVRYFPDKLESLRSAVAEYLNFHNI